MIPNVIAWFSKLILRIIFGIFIKIHFSSFSFDFRQDWSQEAMFYLTNLTQINGASFDFPRSVRNFVDQIGTNSSCEESSLLDKVDLFMVFIVLMALF